MDAWTLSRYNLIVSLFERKPISGKLMLDGKFFEVKDAIVTMVDAVEDEPNLFRLNLYVPSTEVFLVDCLVETID